MNSILIVNGETGEEVEVEYTVHGGYARQTLYSPAEYPEVEFENLPDWADAADVADEVLIQERDFADEDRAEAAWDAREAREDYERNCYDP